MDDPTETPQLTPRQRVYVVVGIVALLLIIVLLIVGVTAMVRNPGQTETLRDIFIIFLAVESLFIGLVLIVLIVQLARLTALIQNEIAPILNSTNETLRTVRGTTSFLSKNLVTPVIKVNSSLASLRQAVRSIRPGR